jgi:hypothetical protein
MVQPTPWRRGNEANSALTPNLIKALLHYTAETKPRAPLNAQGAGMLNARGAVQLAAALRGDTAPITDPTRWSRHIVWGNQQVGSQMALAPRGTPTLEHNLVQGGLQFVDGRPVPSVGTLDVAPGFSDTTAYRPSPQSPAARLGAYAGEWASAALP